MKKKTNEEIEKKIWINWVNPSNQANQSNMGFVLWKFDNWIGKKIYGLTQN